MKLPISRSSAYMGTTSRNIMRAAGAASAAVSRRRGEDLVRSAAKVLSQRAQIVDKLYLLPNQAKMAESIGYVEGKHFVVQQPIPTQ